MGAVCEFASGTDEAIVVPWSSMYEEDVKEMGGQGAEEEDGREKGVPEEKEWQRETGNLEVEKEGRKEQGGPDVKNNSATETGGPEVEKDNRTERDNALTMVRASAAFACPIFPATTIRNTIQWLRRTLVATVGTVNQTTVEAGPRASSERPRALARAAAATASVESNATGAPVRTVTLKSNTSQRSARQADKVAVVALPNASSERPQGPPARAGAASAAVGSNATGASVLHVKAKTNTTQGSARRAHKVAGRRPIATAGGKKVQKQVRAGHGHGGPPIAVE